MKKLQLTAGCISSDMQPGEETSTGSGDTPTDRGTDYMAPVSGRGLSGVDVRSRNQDLSKKVRGRNSGDPVTGS